jgi:hypothetical protein
MGSLLNLYLIFFTVLIFYLPIAPFSFGTNDGSTNSTSDSSIFQLTPYELWFTGVILLVSSIGGILVLVQRIKKPEHFARFFSYQLVALTLFMIGQIFSLSFIPQEFLGPNFPISTVPFTDSQNKTQWVFNIGGPLVETNQQNWLGIQVPIYVIIAGILGAYIRYLYLGIKEFKDWFRLDVFNLEERMHEYELARSTYSRFVDSQFKTIDKEATRADEDFKDIPPEALKIYGEHKHMFLQNVLQAQTRFEKILFALRFDVINHTLYTVGFFFLAPLLAILAWLFLSISGTNNQAIFALVSFAIGLTTKTIVDRITSFVEENLGTSPASRAARTAKLTVRAVNQNNSEIKGCLITLTIEGSSKTSLTPYTFEGIPVDKEIIVTIEDRQDGKFAKWEDGSIIRERTLTLAANMTITAICDAAIASPSPSLSPSITPPPSTSTPTTLPANSTGNKPTSVVTPPPMPMPSSPEPPSIFLYPGEGKVGQELTLAISGKGFAANSKVDLEYT